MPERWLTVHIPATTIEVDLLTEEEMRDDVAHPDAPDGAYDDDLQRITMRKALPLWERLLILAHEGGHMGNDLALEAIRKALSAWKPKRVVSSPRPARKVIKNRH